MVSLNYMPMTEIDLDEVAALDAGIQEFSWSHGNFRDSLVAGHESWLQRQDERVIAFAVTMQVVDETHLLVIGVTRDRQRSGLGARLLDFLCVRARTAGMQRMLLEVRASNDSAIAFYRRFNFDEIGRRRGYYPAHQGREDALVMACSL